MLLPSLRARFALLPPRARLASLSLPPAGFAALLGCAGDDVGVLEQLAGNPAVPPELHGRLSAAVRTAGRPGFAASRLAEAWLSGPHPAPAELAAATADDRLPHLRAAAANPRTPPEALARLARRGGWLVAGELLGNPALPEPAAGRLLRSALGGRGLHRRPRSLFAAETVHAAVAAHPALVGRLGGSPVGRVALADLADVPAPLARSAARSAQRAQEVVVFDVLAARAQNPGVDLPELLAAGMVDPEQVALLAHRDVVLAAVAERVRPSALPRVLARGGPLTLAATLRRRETLAVRELPALSTAVLQQLNVAALPAELEPVRGLLRAELTGRLDGSGFDDADALPGAPVRAVFGCADPAVLAGLAAGACGGQPRRWQLFVTLAEELTGSFADLLAATELL